MIRNWTKSLVKLQLLVLTTAGGCQRCGSKHTRYDYHHRNPNEKASAISSIGTRLEELAYELPKCDVLCRNCHRKTEEELKRGEVTDRAAWHSPSRISRLPGPMTAADSLLHFPIAIDGQQVKIKIDPEADWLEDTLARSKFLAS